MNRYLLFLVLLISVSPAINAQDESKYSAITLSFEGEGVIQRKTKELKLEFPQRFLPGDVVTIKNGSAIVMLFSGKEISLSAVSNYIIPDNETAYTSPLAEMANDKTAQNLLSQSGAAYVLRKPGAGALFPRNSKVLDTANVVLRRLDSNPGEDYWLVIKDSQTQKVIYRKDTIQDKSIKLSEVPFVSGKSYYWTLSNRKTGKTDLGTIVFPSKNNIETSEPESHFDYINAISELYSEVYFFDAFQLVNEAIERFPDYKIYELFKKKIEAN